MTFMANLAANPGGGIYGQPKQTSDEDVLGIVNQMKDREMQDFQKKATFMADLSNRQERMRSLFDPSGPTGGQGQPIGVPGQQGGQGGQPQNTVMARDPNEMTGYEKGELGIRQQGLKLESQKIAQSGKMGEEALGIKSQQEKLNQQKSDQIHEQKLAETQRKADEADRKIALAQQALQQKTDNAEATLKAHQDMAAAVEERHKSEKALMDLKFEKSQSDHKDAMKAMEDKLKSQSRTKQTVTDSTGASRTTTTEKGDAADTVEVVGPNGVKGRIPKDKLDDWNKNHAPQPEDQ
jgi:hypothetical protein